MHGTRLSGLVLSVATLIIAGYGPRAAAETARPDTCAADSVFFMPLHVFVDPLGHPLAAYQVELSDTTATSVIVGVEGGEHPAFRQPPYYDPAALRGNRIILAAYSTARDLPRVRSRVATVHLMAKEAAAPVFVPVLRVAASPDGSSIAARVACEYGDLR